MNINKHFSFAPRTTEESTAIPEIMVDPLSPYPIGFILSTATVGLQTDDQSLPETFVTGGQLSAGIGNGTPAEIIQRKIWTGTQFVDLDSPAGAAILALRPTTVAPQE